jgi:hypothetical protein
MRESRGRSRHTPGREHETPRGINRREECEGERERGQARPRGRTLRVQEEGIRILPELMATSIVPELIHLYIPLGSVSP